mgnify:CR=1 FL=1
MAVQDEVALAVDSETVVVYTVARELIGLQTADGSVAWRASVGEPEASVSPVPALAGRLWPRVDAEGPRLDCTGGLCAVATADTMEVRNMRTGQLLSSTPWTSQNAPQHEAVMAVGTEALFVGLVASGEFHVRFGHTGNYTAVSRVVAYAQEAVWPPCVLRASDAGVVLAVLRSDGLLTAINASAHGASVLWTLETAADWQDALASAARSRTARGPAGHVRSSI